MLKPSTLLPDSSVVHVYMYAAECLLHLLPLLTARMRSYNSWSAKLLHEVIRATAMTNIVPCQSAL